MRTWLVTCWIAIVFILLLTDESLSRKSKSRFRSRKRLSSRKTRLGSSKPTSSSWKPTSSNRDLSTINLGSNKPQSFGKKIDLFENTPDISEMSDFFPRGRESSPNKRGSSPVKPGFPTENHPYFSPVYLHSPAFLEDPDLFKNMHNVPHIMSYTSSRIHDHLQRVLESSANKPGSSTIRSGSSPPYSAYVQDSDIFRNMPNIPQTMSYGSSRALDLLQMHESSPNKPDSSTGNRPV